MRRYWKQAVVIIFMVVAIITPTMDNFINNLEKEIEKKKERLFDRLAEQLGKIRGDILSVRYDLESLLERQAAVETERKRLDERISRVRTIRENALERDRASKAFCPCQAQKHECAVA